MVQAVNYSVIIVKIKCKTPQFITNRKRLTWCELINSYNFFHCQCISPYVTENISARRWSSRDSWASRELQSLDQHLGNRNVLSWSCFRQNFERLGIGDMGLEFCLGLGSEGLVHMHDILNTFAWCLLDRVNGVLLCKLCWYHLARWPHAWNSSYLYPSSGKMTKCDVCYSSSS